MSTITRMLLCLTVLAAGCATSAEAPTAAAGTPSPAATSTAAPTGSESPALYTALCEAAAATDPAAAEPAFAGAHDGLHTLARELQDTDQRAVAGDLLEAKQRVEAAFVAEPLPDDLAQRLDRLLTATADAITASGRPRPTCPEGPTP